MLRRLLGLSLCLVLTGEPFAAEIPVVPEGFQGGAPLSPEAIKVVPGADLNAGVPLEVAIPPVVPVEGVLPERQETQAAQTASQQERAQAQAQRLVERSETRQAQASPETARGENNRVFEAEPVAEPREGFAPEELRSEEPAARSAPTLDRPSSSATLTEGSPSGAWRMTKPVPQGWRVWVPHAITGLNMASGLASIYVGLHLGLVLPAAGLIVLAAVFDAFDGLTARKLGVAGDMGTAMDSQADGVSFGAAPALLAFSAALAPLAHGLPSLALGFAVAAFASFAAQYRLSRYTISAIAAGSAQKPAPFFTGLPSPGGAAALVALAFALPALPAAAALPTALAGTVAVGALMMSRLPYYKLTSTPKGALLGAAAAAVIAAPLVAIGAAALAPAVVLGAYLLSGPAVALYRGGSDVWKKELRRKAFHQTNLLFLPAYALLAWKIGRGWAALAFGGLTAGFGFLEVCRLYGHRLRAFLERSKPLKDAFAWLERVKRPKEDRQPSGIFFGTLGVTIASAIAWFTGDWRYLAAAVLALAIGDAASPLVGMRFGWARYKVDGTLRSLDGTLAGAAVAFTIALALGFSPWLALASAVVFSFVDTYPVKPDDNLWIPATTAASLAGFSWLASAAGGPAVGLAAALIAAAGAWLISRKLSRP